MHDRKSEVTCKAGWLFENNTSSAPLSQSIRLEMADAGILHHLMRLFFARTRDMANLVLMNEIVRLHGLAQRAASFFPNLLKNISTSLPSSPSHERGSHRVGY